MGWREDWSAVTPMLILAVVAFSWGDLLFGIDTGSFGALQVLPSWFRDFGQYDAATDTYSSPIERRSLMNSIVFVGSFVGCAAFEPICSRFGYKITICIAGVIQITAVIVELTAKDWVVFTVGRVIAYIAVGIVENASPGYCSEISPAPLRGLMSGSMTVLVTVGNTIGAGVNLPFGNEQRSLGWIIPTSIQFVPAVGILLLVPFCPESPRWLVARGREGDSLKALNRLRGKREVDNGNTALEIEAIKASAEHDRLQEQGRWLDLFNKKYRCRTVIVLGLFFFYQTTGGQFVNVYGPTFYREQLGFDQEVFVYATLGQGVGIAATIIGIIALDWFGRRPPIIFGASMLVVCNILIGSLGAKENITKVEEGVGVASLILLLSGVKISFQCCSFLLTSEMGGNRMRKKFMGFGTSVDVLFRIVFISVIPFLISAPANLGARFGYVMAVFSLAALIFAIFMVPETKGRALEEMDELFAMKIWPWKWSKAQTTGAGRRVAEIEGGRDVEKVPEDGVRAFDQRKDTIETQHTEDVADSTATRQPK